MPYRELCVDEQLIAVPFNGTLLPYYDLTFQPGEKNAILVDIPPLPPGIHDVLLLQVDRFDQEPIRTEITVQSASRLTLVADGEHSIIPRPYTILEATESFPDRQIEESGFPVILSLNPQEPQDWNAPDTVLRLPLGTPVDFFTYVGYKVTGTEGFDGEPLASQQPLALVMLVDYQQVAISNDTPIIYGIVTPLNKYTRIPMHLLPPQAPGLHQIIMLQIVYPGFPMCLLDGTIRTYPTFVTMSRVGIEIEP